jgi:plasmid stabilization system protein ParE
MTYRVILTARAETDLDRLLTSLGTTSADAATRLAARFWRAVSRLETTPFACGLAHERLKFAEELRHLLFGINPRRRYRALFVVRNETVVILAIRAPGERPVTPRDLRDPG